MRTFGICLAAAAFFMAGLVSAGEMRYQTNSRLAEYFEKAKENRSSLVAFLHKMPKGADLHTHTYGAVYAESFIKMAQQRGLFYDRENMTLTATQPEGAYFTPEEMTENYWKAGEVIEGLSLRNSERSVESGHDHFFRSFDRFAAAMPEDIDGVKEVMSRAFNQGVTYLELMMVADTAPEWRERFERYRREVVEEAAARGIFREFDAKVIYPLVRLAAPYGFRVQVAKAFEVAAAMPDLVVGVTMLAPEDDWSSQEYFREHMEILDEAVRTARKAHEDSPDTVPEPPRMMIHAGELTIEYSTYEHMVDRISTTLRMGHASRIGHGTSIMWEDDIYGTLKYMRDNRVALEFCPSSAEQILKIWGSDHPFPLYWSAGVPVVIGTDDEGVSRSVITLEYAKAAEWFDLSYGEMKWLAFNSLEYSFLPGESYFADGDYDRPRPNGDEIAGTSDKARLQRQMLTHFSEFEQRMLSVLDTFGW